MLRERQAMAERNAQYDAQTGASTNNTTPSNAHNQKQVKKSAAERIGLVSKRGKR